MSHNIYRIIAADDHPIVISGLKLFFQGQDAFQLVGHALGGAQLFKLLDEVDADTLLLDLNLPGTDIYRLIKEIIVKYPNLKIIAYTNYDAPKLMKEVLDYGVNGYLLKDVRAEEIFRAIRTVHQGKLYLCKEVEEKLYGKSKVKTLMSVGSGQENKFQDSFVNKTNLTERERDVIILIAQGFTNKEIAHQLYLSKYTIETHRKNILKKLKFKSSADLVRFATNHGLV